MSRPLEKQEAFTGRHAWIRGRCAGGGGSTVAPFAGVDNLLIQAIAEIGVIQVRNREQAIFKLATVVAEAILAGGMDPFEGALRLSRYAYEAGYPESLAQFEQLADEPRRGEHARPTKPSALTSLPKPRSF